LAAQAFTQSAATEASQQAVTARAAELAYIEFLSDRAARLEELAARPDLARVLTNRSRLAEQRAEVAGRAEAERRAHFVNGLAALDEALMTDRLEDAQRIVQGLLPQFPDDSDLRKKGDRVKWLLRHRLVAPAEQALSEVTRRRYRDDPGLTVARLVELDTSKLPEELGRRVFGVWSNACYSLVQQRGWHTPRRYAPFISRGMIFACPTLDSPETTVSSLGLPEWCPGDVVEDAFLIKASRPLEPPRSKRSHQQLLDLNSR
jgi:hypothetical protein